MARLVRGPALGAGGCGKQPEVAGRGPDRRGTAARERSTVSRTEPVVSQKMAMGSWNKLEELRSAEEAETRRRGILGGPWATVALSAQPSYLVFVVGFVVCYLYSARVVALLFDQSHGRESVRLLVVSSCK